MSILLKKGGFIRQSLSTESSLMVDIAAPRGLVAFLEPTHGHGMRPGCAASLAWRWRGQLIATFVVRELALGPYADFAVGAALTSMLAEYLKVAADSLFRAQEDSDTCLGWLTEN